MKSFYLKFKKLVFDKYLRRYLTTIEISSSLLSSIIRAKNEYYRESSNINSLNYDEFIKKMSSEDYRKYFYKSVGYKSDDSINQIKPFSYGLVGKINSFISLILLKLFYDDVYKKVIFAKKKRDDMLNILNSSENYLKTTTVDERIDRLIELKMLDKHKGESEKKMRRVRKNNVDVILSNDK